MPQELIDIISETELGEENDNMNDYIFDDSDDD